jgi:hypothetical protein
MYGYGDVREPLESSVDLLEVYVEEFIANITSRAFRRSQVLGQKEVRVPDILRVLKQDEKKYLRMPYVLTMTKQLKKDTKDMNMEIKGDNVSIKKLPTF